MKINYCNLVGSQGIWKTTCWHRIRKPILGNGLETQTDTQKILKGHLWVTCCPFNLCNQAACCSTVSSHDVTPAFLAALQRSQGWPHTDDLRDDRQLWPYICDLIINVALSLPFRFNSCSNQQPLQITEWRCAFACVCVFVYLAAAISLQPNQESEHRDRF